MRYPTLTGVLFFSSASVLVLAAGGALAEDTKQAKQVQRVAQKKNKELRGRFAKADTDGDGIIERAEFPADDALFLRFDRDGDAKVTWKEALAFAVEEEVSKAFAEFDGDLSGTLSAAEAPEKSRAMLVAADVDRDGEITGKEAFDFLYNARLGVKTEPGGDAKDSTQEAAKAAKASGGGELGVLGVLAQTFAEFDRDSDGGLAQTEFPASAELFGLMDLDRDGRVTQPELKIRTRFAKRIGERGKRLRERIQARGMGKEVAVAGAEIKGVFLAGRYEEAQRLLDQIELRVELAQSAGK